ncbi:hypothetical protein [Paraprevotella xylaniphila]|uniref:hypothetical protein n=1 Tax=Paraprevotella xylaniphila TaxID=454155 RepID=UPI0010329A18|nr:hypothetical protein [Paraprevotella xylaniphila]
MKGELLINEKDAWTTWGVCMGEGFLDSIDTPAPMKDYIENESRLEHGKRIITENAKVDSRNFTLEFTIMGSTESDYRAKKKAFESELYKGTITVQIPKLNSEVYRLVYLGKSISYGLSLNRCFGKFSAKFEEPNPANRGDL